MDISFSSLFLLMFVGMGPLKSVLMFMEMTENVDSAIQRRMAVTTVLTATCGALALLFLGSLLQQLLHFSLGSLNICGGIILLILSVRIVLGDDDGSVEGHELKDPIEKAVSPLGTPLTLSPLGMVVLVTFSAEITQVLDYVLIISVIVGMACIDLVVFLFSAKLAHYISHAVLVVAEKLFSILVGALAVQLIVNGMTSLGIIDAVVH